jgi:probable HAF family extracellular repeat protein
MQDIGNLGGVGVYGGTHAAASAISNSTQIVGQSDNDLNIHAYLWHDGTMIDIDPLLSSFSSANGINIHGQIVGDGNNSLPFFY